MRLSVFSLLFATAVLFASTGFAAPIDINQADAATLEAELVGVGADKAAAIVQYRDEHGPFGSIDELANVKGIGEKTIEKNRDKISVAQ